MDTFWPGASRWAQSFRHVFRALRHRRRRRGRFTPRTETFQRIPPPSAYSEVRHVARDAKGRIRMALSGANKVAVVE
jgi:hypothetical protein